MKTTTFSIGVLMVGLLPAMLWAAPVDPAYWESGQYWEEVIIDDGFVYRAKKVSSFDSNELAGYAMLDYIGDEINVVVPDSVFMLSTTVFWERHYIKTITLPKSCWYIEGMMTSFDFCDSLEAVHVEEGNPVYSSHEGVVIAQNKIKFYPHAKKTEEYEVPDYITYVDEDISNPYLKKIVFLGDMPKSYYGDSWDKKLGLCSNLEYVEVQSNDPNYTTIDGVLYSKDVNSLVFCPRGRTQLVVPSSVTQLISDNILMGCRKLTEVTAEAGGMFTAQDNILYFAENTQLVFCVRNKKGNVSGLPSTLRSVNRGAFAYCTEIRDVSLPTVEQIGDDAFVDCMNLRGIQLPSATVIGNRAFSGCAGLSVAELPKAATIGRTAFSDCVALTTVTLPPEGKSIGSYAFQNTGLSSITIPKGVLNVEESTFENCTRLSSVTIPATVDTIREAAFKNTAIAWVTIPETVTCIQQQAFAYCWNLREVTVEWDTPPESVSADAFLSTTSAEPTLRVPMGTRENYEDVQPWRYFVIEEYELPSRLTVLADEEVVVYTTPASDVLSVWLCEGITLKRVQVFDMSGRLVHSGTSGYLHKGELGLAGTGYCVLRVETSQGWYTGKVML